MTAKLWGEWQISAGRAIARDTTGRKSMPVLQQRTGSIPTDEFAHIGIAQFSPREREREREIRPQDLKVASLFGNPILYI